MLADERAAGNKKTRTEKDIVFQKRYYSNLQTLFTPASYTVLLWELLKLLTVHTWLKNFVPRRL